MYDHRCLWCLAPELQCAHLDSHGCCIKQPREFVDGRWVYAPGVMAPGWVAGEESPKEAA